MSKATRMRDVLNGLLDSIEAFKPTDPDIHIHVLWCGDTYVVHMSKGLSEFMKTKREEFHDNPQAMRAEIDKRLREVKP